LDVAGELHPLAVRDQLAEAWRDFLASLAAGRPLVLLIEDLHWAEEPLLDLLERLIGEVDCPLFLIGTARPELLDKRPTWSGGVRNASVLGLEPLSEDDSAQLVAELVSSSLPDDVRGVVVERAEGNPFFIEELLGTLIDRGYLQRSEEGWRPGALFELDIPDSVHALVAARIDLLPAAEKRALQAAAVTGRVFWAGPVIKLIEGDKPDFHLLEQRDFIHRRSASSMAGEQEYTFKHALTREIAYTGLPKAQRAHLHAAFADWLEQLGKGDECASLLAHHYGRAVDPQDADLAWSDEPARLEALSTRALQWLRRAAELAVSRYEIEEALTLLDRALPLSHPGRERVEVLRAIARAHALRYSGENFWTAMQEAIREACDPELQAELYADLAYETALRSGIWKRTPERGDVVGWVERALAGSPPRSPARAKALVAKARWVPAEGVEAAAEASELADRLGDAELLSAAWDSQGIVAWVAGEHELGRSWRRRRFELLDRISNPDARAEIYSAPITGCVLSGEFEEARGLARAHGEIASRLTPHHRLHAVAIEIEVEELLGQWSTVRNLQERARLAVDDNLDTPCVRNPRSLLVCALANEYLGDGETARSLEARANELWMEGYGFTLDTPRLRLALARGDLALCEQLLARPGDTPGWYRGWFVLGNASARLDALAALGRRDEIELEAPLHLREGTYLEPFALRALGLVREDDELIERALGRFLALGLDWDADKTRSLLVGPSEP
jgi:hypothetical protein